MTVEQRLEQVELKNQQMQLQNKKIQLSNRRLSVALTIVVAVMCAVMTMAASSDNRGDFDIVTARY